MATPQDEERRVQEIVRELQGATLGGHALAAVLPKLRRLVDADLACAFKAMPAGQGHKLAFLFLEGFGAGAEKQAADWFAGAGPGALLHDPTYPAPEERNQVVREPVACALFARLGVAQKDQLRVLVCDGAKLLAWVGAFAARPFTEQDVERLQGLVPAMESRLALESSLYR